MSRAIFFTCKKTTLARSIKRDSPRRRTFRTPYDQIFTVVRIQFQDAKIGESKQESLKPTFQITKYYTKFPSTTLFGCLQFDIWIMVSVLANLIQYVMDGSVVHLICCCTLPWIGHFLSSEYFLLLQQIQHPCNYFILKSHIA